MTTIKIFQITEKIKSTPGWSNEQILGTYKGKKFHAKEYVDGRNVRYRVTGDELTTGDKIQISKLIWKQN